MNVITAFLCAVLLVQACSVSNNNKIQKIKDPYQAKSYFNSEWKKQGISPEQWYYRQTVIEAPANTKALTIAEGHWLHPETLRFEITKEMLIGWRSHASVLGAEHEFSPGVRENYRGAPIVAFAITSHFDIDDQTIERAWQDREYIKVDFTRNIVDQLQRQDANEGIDYLGMNSPTTHLVDNSFVGDPKRFRFSGSHFEFVTRHPVEVSMASAYGGAYGPAFKEDSAAVVIDIRHAFLRKTDSDFISLPYPDNVVQADADNTVKKIAINNRFGLFRTSYNGRSIYDRETGSTIRGAILHATIFNIWQKSRDEFKNEIPMAMREVKPIVYYTNVLHPDDLIRSSKEVANEWDLAFRTAVYYAQPQKYKNLKDVPTMWVLKLNSCNLDNVQNYINSQSASLKSQVEDGARVSIEQIRSELLTASNLKFNDQVILNTSAKRKLEQICAALEYYSESFDEPFVYQRAGDMRFNLMNLEDNNNSTGWSGYGPMISDSITGETISATANINLKYINERAQLVSKQIGLLKLQNPGLAAVFGAGVFDFDNKTNTPLAPKSIENLRNIIQDNTEYKYAYNTNVGMSSNELSELVSIQENLTDIYSTLPKTNTHKKIKTSNIAYDALPKSQEQIAQQRPMDSLNFVDDISMGAALKYADLNDDERFLKIREAIYKATMLHEIGHNMGLRHNMAASADALNYQNNFWWIENLPSDLKAAKLLVHDKNLENKLQKCIDDNVNYAEKLNGRAINTKDCLQQKNTMFASVMDYHASAMADIIELGRYDKAAIKWAYAQVAEVFPANNLVVDFSKVELSKWLRLNSYKHISQALLKNSGAIQQREHVKVSWNASRAINPPPNNAVPYMYCDDPSGFAGPKCLAFDFGPNMQSSAKWLKSRYWEQYLFTHFAKDSAWSTSATGVSGTLKDVDILNKFTHILRWYHKYLKEDKDFLGSYAEQDYLKAIAMGLNHFAHVLGMPDSGAHVSSPIWALEEEQSLEVSSQRLAPANVLIPLGVLSTCEAQSITTMDGSGNLHGSGNYKFVEVPLGMGRPYQNGYAQSNNDRLGLYSGSALLKKYALMLMTAPLVGHLSVSSIEQKDLLNLSWYRMFPEAVGKILSAVIKQNYQELGPVYNKLGQIVPRDIINEKTLEIINYQNVESIIPTSDSSLPVFALASALAFVPKTVDTESNLKEALKISCTGSQDEISLSNADLELVKFVHLSGQEYVAARTLNMQPIGADLLLAANRQKDRYLRLVQCIENEESRNNDPFCRCVKTESRNSLTEWVCCDQENSKCPEPELEAVGEGVCSLKDLENRRNRSHDRLESMVGFIDEARRLTRESEMLQ